jgi:hypothetical protein
MSIGVISRVVDRTLFAATALAAACSFASCAEYGFDSAELVDSTTDGIAAEALSLGSTEQALGEASCATATPDAEFDQHINFQSPRSYSARGCFKGIIVDVSNLRVSGGGLGHTALFAQYSDTLPTDPAACERLWAAGYVYNLIDGNWEKGEFQSARGSWQFDRCRGPSLVFDDALFAESDDPGAFRVVLSARTDQTGGAATRRISLFDSSIPH